MSEAFNHGGDISTLSVQELFGLLNSPHIEIVEEVRTLIKGLFTSTSDRWLVHGLIDYFFLTNSKRIVDLLISAPEPHDKYLLERISDGIKSGDRFRHISILLYAVSRSPPPTWIHKKHYIDNVINNMLFILSPKYESDLSVLVSGVTVIVVLLSTIPLPMYKHLMRIFDSFWSLVHWTPNRDQDESLKPYLQVAVYSLFHRLYALYPCNLLCYLRGNMIGEERKAWFLGTLRPMIERVRLHPLLISETKETECNKNRWLGLEPNLLLQECSKLCLDPLQDMCEDTYYVSSTSSQSLLERTSDNGNFILLSSEGSFWSPGVLQSPSSGTTSVPHTPVYTYQMLSNHSTSIGLAESPPETAIEATPETTPFTSPMPNMNQSQRVVETRYSKKTFSNVSTKINLTETLEKLEEKRTTSTLPTKKEILPFPSKDITYKSERYLIHDKLQQIQLEREENRMDGMTGGKKEEIQQDIKIEDEEVKSEKVRKRKIGVYDHNFSGSFENIKLPIDNFLDESESKSDMEDKFEKDTEFSKEISNDNQESFDTDSEGLGVPSQKSITELVKNVKIQRLRFLSQCGPPPNIGFCTSDSRSRSPSKVDKPTLSLLRQKSRSFPILPLEVQNNFSKKEMTSLSLSPTHPIIETFDACTQTEEVPVVNPYEQLLEVLAFPGHAENKENSKCSHILQHQSPYQILDQYLQYGKKGEPSSNLEIGLNNIEKSRDEIELRSLYSLFVLERYKREIHAERNRRLLSKIKKLHLLQESDKEASQEKKGLVDEITLMKNSIKKLKDKNLNNEKLLNDMVDKRLLLDLRLNNQKTCQQREHLLQMSLSVKEENKSLNAEVDRCRSKIHEMQRQLDIFSKQGSENVTLRKQVTDLNKKIVILGEIQLEMKAQMRNLQMSQRKTRNSQHAQELNDLRHKIEHLEAKHREDATSLDATMLRIQQLEAKLQERNEAILNHKEELNDVSLMWQEQCDVLEKRNQELHSINITLESQMHHLLRPEKEGATSHLVANETKRFATKLPVENENTFVDQVTDNVFKSPSSPVLNIKK